jgi:hypothetical protein
MNPKAKPCGTAQQSTPSQAIKVLFRPDADQVSKHEVDLVKTMLREVLAEMAHLEADAEKSSPSCIQVEPRTDFAIQSSHNEE